MTYYIQSNFCQINWWYIDINVKLTSIESTSKTATIWWLYNGNPTDQDSAKQTVIQYITEDKFRSGNISSGHCGTCQISGRLVRSPLVILSLERHTKYVLRVIVVSADSVQYGDWQYFTTKGTMNVLLLDVL